MIVWSCVIQSWFLNQTIHKIIHLNVAVINVNKYHISGKEVCVIFL